MTVANHLERLSETIREESSKPESLRESGAPDDGIRRAESLALEMRRAFDAGDLSAADALAQRLARKAVDEWSPHSRLTEEVLACSTALRSARMSIGT